MGANLDPDSIESNIHPAEIATDAVLESVPGGVIRFAADGRIHDLNSEAVRILRLPRNELREWSILDLARIAVNEDGSICPLEEFPPQACLVSSEPTHDSTIGLRVGDRLVWVVLGAAPACLEGDASAVGVVATLVEVTRLKRADAALRLSEQRFRSMFERHDSVMLLIDYSTGAIVDANGAAERFYGWPREKMRTMFVTDINQLPATDIRADMTRVSRDRKSGFIFPHRLASGETRQVEVRSSPIDYEEKRLLFSIVHDVSDRERLEDELRQSQKHEAIGQLSGGVAHAFNNTMTIINGCVEQLLDDAPPNHPWRETLKEIFAAGSRAAELTRQLLSFSRKELIQPETLDLNRLISNLKNLLLRLIGEHIEIVVDLDHVVCAIKADARSIEQAVINLVLNARDAMPNGGVVTISTLLEAGYAWSPSFVGPRVVLTVTDIGTGMDDETRARAFEPFFTTKAEGEATGLGLATVYSIVRQAGGEVDLQTTEGVGTVVAVSFRVVTDPVSEQRRPTVARPTGGTETILLVEDELGVRNLAVRSLERHGYHVLSASRGDDAIEIAKSYSGPIHLLITDVVMPGMSGPELVQKVCTIRPEIRGFYISGYAEDEVDESEVLFDLLPKPFTPSSLIEMVESVLDSLDED